MTDKIKVSTATIDISGTRVSYKYHKVAIAPLEWLIPRLLERAPQGYKVISLTLESEINLLNQL